MSGASVLRSKNGFHLARKYARIHVRGRCLFREANGFPRTNHELNYEFLETYNGQGQIYGHIFAQNGGCWAYYPSNIFAKGKMFTNIKLTFAAWDVYFSVFPRTTLWTNKHVFSSATIAKRSLILNYFMNHTFSCVIQHPLFNLHTSWILN